MNSPRLWATTAALTSERGLAASLIGLQPTHAQPNKTRAASNTEERLVERQAMVQSGADYLDTLRAMNCSAKVAGAGARGWG